MQLCHQMVPRIQRNNFTCTLSSKNVKWHNQSEKYVDSFKKITKTKNVLLSMTQQPHYSLLSQRKIKLMLIQSMHVMLYLLNNPKLKTAQMAFCRLMVKQTRCIHIMKHYLTINRN